MSKPSAFIPIGAHNASPPANWTVARTLTRATNATKLRIQALTQNVRYTLDGTAPTASLGFQIKAGDPPIEIPVPSAATIKVIEETATASVQYQWGR